MPNNGVPTQQAVSKVDVLLVCLGTTAGLRTADQELVVSLERAGATVAQVTTQRPKRTPPTMALMDLFWALAARKAARAGIAAYQPKAIIYSTATAALLWPKPGAIRFDAPSQGNRPGRHGVWQRPLERLRFNQSPLLLPWSEGGMAEAPDSTSPSVVLPVSCQTPQLHGEQRSIAAITYGANPSKKGLDLVLAAWQKARRKDELLVVAGCSEPIEAEGVLTHGLLPTEEYQALLRRAKVFVTAPRREDYGIAQLDALAAGCQLVTTASPGPYAALPLARTLDSRLVGNDLAGALRTALDAPRAEYATEANELLAPYRRDEIDRVVAEEVLPKLLESNLS